MADTRALLERGVGTVEPGADALDSVLRLVARRRRGQRVASAGLALALTGGIAGALWSALPSDETPIGDGSGSCSDHTVEVFVPSESMLPTFAVGDHVLVDTAAYEGGVPARGDVVAFQVGQDLGGYIWLKRVIGLPGDRVELRGGTVYVNGAPLAEPYLEDDGDRRDFGPEDVRPGMAFVLGDNRLNSNDSRFSLGQIPLESVIGKACGVVSPEDRGSVLIPTAPGVTAGGG